MILASHGVDIPTDVDGDVLDIFIDQPAVGSQEPTSSEETRATTDSTEVEDRLKQLGYM